VLVRYWKGFRQARALLALSRLPRNPAASCPACHEAPVAGAVLVCAACKTSFDPFASLGVCPRCQTAYAAVRCIDCGEVSSIAAWIVPRQR
jgi:hypothetical protein